MTAARSARLITKSALTAASILVVLFLLSVAVPVAQGKLSANVPQSGGFTESAGGGFVYINGTANVSNGGLYSIYDLSFDAVIIGANGLALYNHTSSLPAVHPGSKSSLDLSIPVPYQVIYGLYALTGPSGTTNLTISITLQGLYALGLMNFTIHMAPSISITPSSFAAAAQRGR